MSCQLDQRAKIESFDEEFRFLSNFYPTTVIHDGQVWPSAEHAYQAAKTNIKTQKEAIHRLPSARDAKKMGKLIDIRSDWDDVKVDIMYEIVRDKFRRNHHLSQLLLATEDAELIEGNWWGDTFWGVCKGEGLNNLGKILMRIREELKNEIVI